jgi:farnesyl-diphosphate farnesyltransferase
MPPNRFDRSVEDDLAWCYDAVHGVSRTFSLTIEELDEPMAREITVGYLLCRVADTVEDAGHVPPDEQRDLLELYSRVLDREAPADVWEFEDAVEEWIPEDPNDDWSVVAAAPRVVRVFRSLDEQSREAIRPAVRELTEGMAMFVDRYADAGGLRIQTLDELEEYCWYAAGTVGTLVTGLVSRDADPNVVSTLEANARSFSMLLQLVNVAKDAATDYQEENNVYLPIELLRKRGVSLDALADPAQSSAVAPVIEGVTRHAEGYLDDAQTWLETMPESRGNTLAAWAVPFLLAVGTIRELRERPEDVVEEGNVKISRKEVSAVCGQFVADAKPSLAELRSKIRRRPLHEYPDSA